MKKNYLKSITLFFTVLIVPMFLYVNAQCINQGIGPNQDYDCDGVINKTDLDDDNDGILDNIECAGVQTSTVFFPLDASVLGTTAGDDSTGVVVTKDISSSLGLPVGSVIVKVTNIQTLSGGSLSMRPTLPVSSRVTFEFSGTQPVELRVGFGGRVSAGSIKTFYAVDNTSYSYSTTTAGNFINGCHLVTGSHPYYNLTRDLSGTDTSNCGVPENKIFWESKDYVSSIQFYRNSDAAPSNTGYFVEVRAAISTPIPCDDDGDGVPNYYDLDSDNDGCLDAVEGGGNIYYQDLVDAAGLVSSGSSAPKKNLCATAYTGNPATDCVRATGVPVTVNQSQGQSLLPAVKNATLTPSECAVCLKPQSATAAEIQETKLGITLLKRAGSGSNDWPGIRKGGHVALESKTKGFVITRATTTKINNISNPQEGMMVYDTILGCMKIFDGSNWNCFSKPGCP